MAVAMGDETEYSLLDYWAIARKRWPWILVPIVLITAAAVAYSVNQPARYASSARVLLADTASQRTLDPSSQNTGFLSRELSNEISLANSDTVISLVEDQLGDLPDVAISSESDADVLVFEATAADAVTAADHANTWASMYVQVKRDEAVGSIDAAADSLQVRLEDLRRTRQEIRQPLDDLDDRIARTADPDLAADLQRQYDRLADDLRYELELVTAQAESTVASLTDLELQGELAAVGEARIVQFAAPPLGPANPPLSRNVALGVVLGAMIGAGLALLAETRDTTIKTAAQVQAITDLPVLASIPEADRKALPKLALAAHTEPEGKYADGYHKVRSSVEFAGFENPISSILVTSANASEGKTTTSSNLALALCSVGKRTVLIDTDYRRPKVHTHYNVPQTPGLSDHLLHGADLKQVAYGIDEPGLEQILILPTGTIPPNPAAFVGTERFRETIRWITKQTEVVILDSPPLLAVSEPLSLSKHVDAVVLTARAGKTTKAELAEVVSTLKQNGANVLGVVLVGVSEAETYGKYGYYRQEPAERRGRGTGAAPAGNLWGDRPVANGNGNGAVQQRPLPSQPRPE